MKLSWGKRIYLAVLVTLVGIISYQGCQLKLAKHTLEDEMATRQAAEMSAAGWVTVVEDQKAQLSLLQASLQAASKAGSKPVVSFHGVGREVTVPLPQAATRLPSPTLEPSTSTSSPADTPFVGSVAPHPQFDQPRELVDPSPHLLLTNDVQIAVNMLSDGKLMWAGAVNSHFRLSDNSWNTDLVQPLDTEGSTFSVPPNIQRALFEYTHRPPRITIAPRPLREWRAGWFAGPGVGVTPGGDVEAGVFVGWGLHF